MSALVEHGVRQVIVSSGSRCAPLVLAAGSHARLRLWTNPDERSAAFFALGAAKGSQCPAALICTSGTAAANYYPAIIEASMSGVPLIVITADRPPSLRGTGAPQTIKQVNLYGDYVLTCDDLVVPGSQHDDAQDWMSTTQRAVRLAIDSAGPVHLNAPFDEPLLPDHKSVKVILAETPRRAPTLSSNPEVLSVASETRNSLSEIAQLLATVKRPVIVCGPNATGAESAEFVITLADRIGAPILADVASQLRGNRNIIAHYDLILRDAEVRTALAPDVILRLGGLPTSKALNEWIASAPPIERIGISTGSVADPGRVLTRTVKVDCQSALRMILNEIPAQRDQPPEYRDTWERVDDSVATVLVPPQADSIELLEPNIVAHVCEHAGSDANLFLSNSMPIRWADMYAAARDGFPSVFVNRGANGIDGIISTAAGVAVATQRTTICVIGDLTFLHDQNGLWRLAEEQVPLKIVLLNNDGGGVFHFLPISTHTDHFERLVAMPHGIDLAQLCSAHGIRYERAQSLRELAVDFEASLHRPGPEVIEVRTDRSLNHKRHQEVIATVSEAVRQNLGIA